MGRIGSFYKNGLLSPMWQPYNFKAKFINFEENTSASLSILIENNMVK